MGLRLRGGAGGACQEAVVAPARRAPAVPADFQAAAVRRVRRVEHAAELWLRGEACVACQQEAPSFTLQSGASHYTGKYYQRL